MIETMAKTAEVAQKTPEQSNKMDAFNPDQRIDSEVKNEKLDEVKQYNPDERITEYKPDGEIIESKEGEKQYFDSNGNLYRIGDRLLPNVSFEINGYEYKTDKKGRVVLAEGKLSLPEEEYKRNMEKVKEKEGQEYKETDDQGHLIGHQFGGSDKLENLVPMDSNLNRGDYAKLEKTLADAVKDKADVRLKVEPVYENGSTRPSEFRVSYSINGDRETRVFRNERVE